MKQLFFILLFASLLQCKPKTDSGPVSFTGKPAVPASILNQHDSLLSRLKKFYLLGDSTSRAAVKLYELLDHHFKEEEDYALPALGLLPGLANGKIPEESKEIIQLIEKFRSNNPHMSFEHQMVKAYLDELRAIAAKEQHPEVENFSRDLVSHAREEDELFFPAVILIGEYLKLKNP